MAARLLVLLIAGGLALAPVVPHVARAGVLMLPVCGGGPAVPIPIDGKPHPGDGSVACHAACIRKHPLDEDTDMDC